MSASRMYVAIVFAAFFGFVAFSNIFDWDHFLAAAEVDLRSWLNDGRPPLWSYQLCAGVTRAGDPQAFGLSPLFLPVILFGSFWGLKTLALLTAVLGYFYLKKLFVLVGDTVRPGAAADPEFVKQAGLIGLLTIFGNYFLWHLHHGHITFVTCYLGIALIYYIAKAARESLSRNELVAASLIAWAYFSAGFYHSFVFFMFPFYVACGLYAAFRCLVAVRSKAAPDFRPVGRIALFHGVGLLLSSYKWWRVLEYQRDFPRVLEDRALEYGGPLRALVYQFFPTIDYNYLGWFDKAGFGDKTDIWGIWEYSAFSVVNWILVGACVRLYLERKKNPEAFRFEPGSSGRRLFSFMGIYLFTVLCFGLGDTSPVSFHSLLNEYALNDSVRVIGRYQAGLVLIFAAALVIICRFRRDPLIEKLLVAGLCIWFLNLATFRKSLFFGDVFQTIQSAQFDSMPDMTTVIKTKHRGVNRSYMYLPILKGQAVANCYDPIGREVRFMAEFPPLNPEEVMEFPLFFGDSLPEACVKNSFVTQSRIFPDSSCPPGTCLRINAMNVYERDTYFKYDESTKKYCLRP